MREKYIILTLALFLITSCVAVNLLQNTNIVRIQTINNSDLRISSHIVLQPNGIALIDEVNDQTSMRICTDGAGGAIITWQDDRAGLGTGDVYAQRFNSTHTYWTTNGTLVCNEENQQDFIRIISDGNNGAIIAWRDQRGGSQHCYAQKIDSAGNSQWTDNGTAVCINQAILTNPQMCVDGDGGVIIVWNDDRNGNRDLFAQRINSTGQANWTANGVDICNATGEQSAVDIIPDGSGGAIIAWSDRRMGVLDYDIYIQRINSTGHIQWANNGTPICTADNRQFTPNICTDGGTGAIIAWYDERDIERDVYVQKIDSNGVPQWEANGTCISNMTGDQTNTKMISDGLGGAIIVWEDTRGANQDIYAQRINGTGHTQWTSNGTLIVSASDVQDNIDLCSNGANGAFIVWEDSRGASNSQIWGQLISMDGTLIWSTSGAPICTAGGESRYPKICNNGSTGAIVAWIDSRGADIDIYVQMLTNDTYMPSVGGTNLLGMLLLGMQQPSDIILPVVIIVIVVAVVIVIVVFYRQKK